MAMTTTTVVASLSMILVRAVNLEVQYSNEVRFLEARQCFAFAVAPASTRGT
jgi:hypothetical protein